jgi:hypothetical protein
MTIPQKIIRHPEPVEGVPFPDAPMQGKAALRQAQGHGIPGAGLI